MKARIRLGFAPTRRSIFSAPDAVKYANLTRERLNELGIEYVDIKEGMKRTFNAFKPVFDR